MKKSLVLVLLLSIVISLFAFPVVANENIKVTLNGELMQLNKPALMQNDRVLLPIRAISEILGSDVYWNEQYEIVGVIKNDIKVLAKINEVDILKYTGNSIEQLGSQLDSVEFDENILKIITVDTPPQIINDTTYIPVRAVSQALGATIEWDENTNTVLITCNEDFIKEKNNDKVFFDQFIAWFDKR